MTTTPAACFLRAICICLSASTALLAAGDPLLQELRGEYELGDVDLNAYAEALSHPTVLREFRELGLSKERQDRFTELTSIATLLGSKEFDPDAMPKQRAFSLVSQVLGHVTFALAADISSRRKFELESAIRSWNQLVGDRDASKYAQEHFSTFLDQKEKLLEIPYLFSLLTCIAEEVESAEEAKRIRDFLQRDGHVSLVRNYYDETIPRFEKVSKRGKPQKPQMGPLDDVSKEVLIHYTWGFRGLADINQVVQSEVFTDRENEVSRANVQKNQKELNECWKLFSDHIDELLLAPR